MHLHTFFFLLVRLFVIAGCTALKAAHNLLSGLGIGDGTDNILGQRLYPDLWPNFRHRHPWEMTCQVNLFDDTVFIEFSA
jgi:hypothetical protein